LTRGGKKQCTPQCLKCDRSARDPAAAGCRCWRMRCPLYSRKRKSCGPTCMSAKGQKRTCLEPAVVSERPLRCATLLHSVKKREDFSSDAQALQHFGYSICRPALLGHLRSAEARHVNRSRSEAQMGRRPHEGRSRSFPSDLSSSVRLELRGAG